MTVSQTHATRRRFRRPRGTNDILPAEWPYWDYVIDTARRVARRFGYERIQTPVFEDAGVFLRGVGEGTDIVEKEMYIFEDRGGDRLALRPEGTANTMRAYLEHGMANLPQPVRLYYVGAVYRYDRPQAGRYREHHQFGVEVIGDADPMVDAEVIDVLATLYRELGIADLTLLLNSIGDPACRRGYLETLRSYYETRLDEVCADCRVRFQKNPLRLLDCKNARCQPVIRNAPRITEHLCDACRDHFDALRRYLDALGIPYVVTPTLVRGFDYYTRTVFEFVPPGEGAQSTVGGGGRYDVLMEALGGPPTPGIGFGTGIERIILNLKRLGIDPPSPPPPDVYVAHASSAARVEALRLAADLRRAGLTAVVGSAARSLKSQFRHADALGVRYVAVLGDAELARGVVTLRSLADGTQHEVPRADVVVRILDAAT
ncbi:MAG TPA: histidine--tRNA ligase [Dehalococcoidia bacterium]|nr:histidine--tRNA ligase [Dehalococcoidia bacterium]